MLNIKDFLEEIQASPYREVKVVAPHTGMVELAGIKKGDKVDGPEGKASVLAYLTRERNKKPITAPEKGEIVEVFVGGGNKFVQAGEVLIRIRHYLTKEDVIEIILQKALNLFYAPEKAKYYFTPEVDVKIKASGAMKVRVKDGMELFIASRMKRETPLAYTGPEGLIYAVYFQHGESVDAGGPLIGVCPEDQLSVVQDVVSRVKTEWREPN